MLTICDFVTYYILYLHHDIKVTLFSLSTIVPISPQESLKFQLVLIYISEVFKSLPMMNLSLIISQSCDFSGILVTK